MHFTTRKAALVLGGLTAGLGTLGAAQPALAAQGDAQMANVAYDEFDDEMAGIGAEPMPAEDPSPAPPSESIPDDGPDPAAEQAAAEQAAAEQAAAEQAAAQQAAAEQAAAQQAADEQAAAQQAAAEQAAAQQAAAAAEQAAAEQAAAEKAAAEQAAAEAAAAEKAAAEAEGASGASTPDIAPVAAPEAPTMAPALPETGTMPSGNSFGPGLISLAGSGMSQPATDELKARAAKKDGGKAKAPSQVQATQRTSSVSPSAAGVESAAPIAQRSVSLAASGQVPKSSSFELTARKGETLWSLAAHALGKDASLDQIVRLVTYLASLNRHLEGETLGKGEQVRLPVLFEGHDLRIIEFNRLHAG